MFLYYICIVFLKYLYGFITYLYIWYHIYIFNENYSCVFHYDNTIISNKLKENIYSDELFW